MKNALIARTKNQAQGMANFLQHQGFNTFVEPLFTIEKLAVRKFSAQEINSISAAIITSSNASCALIDSNLPKNMKIFSVGKKSAEKLLKNGFKNISFPDEKCAEALLDLIIKAYPNKQKRMLYFHGSLISLDFKKELESLGFKVKKIPSYTTQEIDNFSDNLLNFSQKKFFDFVLIFSSNSAKIFYKLAKKHNLLEYFGSTQILCLSGKILSKLKEFGFKNSATFSEIPFLKNYERDS